MPETRGRMPPLLPVWALVVGSTAIIVLAIVIVLLATGGW
jgi:hypothetical protein